MYNVDENWKKKCLSSANTKWRQWKSALYTKYIEPFEEKYPEMFRDPPPNSGSPKEDLKDFVIYRMTDTARVRSIFITYGYSERV